jgi:hypothetical protein
MAGKGASFGEDHSPGNLGHPAIKLTIDEITNSSQAQSDGSSHYDEVCNLPEGFLIPPGEKNTYEENADETSMKGHASMPYGYNLEGISEISLEIVKENISQSGSHHETKNEIKIEILHFRPRKVEILLFYLITDEQIGSEKSQNIHHPVPTYPNGAHFENNRIDIDVHLCLLTIID